MGLFFYFMDTYFLFIPSNLSAEQKTYAESLLILFPLTPVTQTPEGAYLTFCNSALSLFLPGFAKPLSIDFSQGALSKRFQGGQKELLLQSVNPKKYRFLCDATGGLGRDTLILARNSEKLLLFERHPIFAALLSDALKRAHQDPILLPLIKRIQFVFASFTESALLLQQDPPEVIYLDPMFPARSKSAAVKKEAQFLQALTFKDSDQDLLLPFALQWATKRVVVKRPLHALPLAACPPSFTMKGKTVRFDVYLS